MSRAKPQSGLVHHVDRGRLCWHVGHFGSRFRYQQSKRRATTHVGVTRCHHELVHCGIFVTVAEVASPEAFEASLQRARRHRAVFPESRGQAASSCRRILFRDLEAATCASSVAREQHRVHQTQWTQLQSAEEQMFSGETRPPWRPHTQLTRQMCVDKVDVVSEDNQGALVAAQTADSRHDSRRLDCWTAAETAFSGAPAQFNRSRLASQIVKILQCSCTCKKQPWQQTRCGSKLCKATMAPQSRTQRLQKKQSDSHLAAARKRPARLSDV